MVHAKQFGKTALLAAACCLLLGACGGNKAETIKGAGTDKAGGGMENIQSHALFDRDSRNNENPSLGVKEYWADDQKNRRQAADNLYPSSPDMTNRHLATRMTFDKGIAAKVKSQQGIKDALVLLTDSNAYVAVVPEGHSPEHEADPRMMTEKITDKGGAGLFATDKGVTQVNWTDPGGLSTGQTAELTRVISLAVPTNVQRVFVSANPNFVQRMRLYSQEDQLRGSMAPYGNEFNTLVQRVFPDNNNQR